MESILLREEVKKQWWSGDEWDWMKTEVRQKGDEEMLKKQRNMNIDVEFIQVI